MPALGERFRAAREARGLSLSDVAEQIRIRSVYLAAIEDDNWNAIGAPVYVRGFLRTYARFLGLDPEEVVADFNAEPHAPPPQQPAESSALRSERARTRGGASSFVIWIAAGVAVLLIAFVVYQALTLPGRGPSPVAEASVEASAVPSATASALPSPLATPRGLPAAADGPKSFALVLSAPSWLRVTIDGDVSIEGTFPAGTSKTFHGKNALLRVGNAGGVEVYVDGRDVGKLGKSGDVVERAFTL
jgi:cytoskeleton protein RodZ